MRLIFACFSLIFFTNFVQPAIADSWLMPKVETVYSANKAYRFITTPRDVGSPLTYFEAKAANKELPKAIPANGRLERLDGNRWQTVWAGDLVNEVAPVEVIVSDDGANVVTFDNWHMAGFGDNVVAIYGQGGKLVRKFSLSELMPAYFVETLPRSVSSVWWRGNGTAIDGNTLTIPIVGPQDISDRQTAFVRRVDLSSGALEPLSPDVLESLAPRFCIAHIASVRDFNTYLDFERNDLVLPQAKDRDGWTRFQYQLIRRTKPKTQSDELDLEFNGAFDMPVSGEYMFKSSRRIFIDALTGDATDTPLRWLSGRDLESMTVEIERVAKGIKPNQLVGVQLRFITDSVHWPRIQSSMSKSGAELVFVDRNKPVPQRPEELANLPPKRDVDPACSIYVKTVG